jgi:hypothetical protein
MEARQKERFARRGWSERRSGSKIRISVAFPLLQVQKLLLSLKTTGIPDESFFPTAGLWLQEKAQVGYMMEEVPFGEGR